MSITISFPPQHREQHFTFFRMLCTFQRVHKIIRSYGIWHLLAPFNRSSDLWAKNTFVQGLDVPDTIK